MVDQTEETLNTTVASATNNNEVTKDLSEVADRYEQRIRDLVIKLTIERDALKKDNSELESNVVELRRQKDDVSSALAELKEKAIKEITTLRNKCQHLEAQLQAFEAAQAASEAGKSTNGGLYPNLVVLQAEEEVANDVAAEEAVEEAEAPEDMVLADAIEIHDD